MGSPFRKSTIDEERIFDTMVRQMADQFIACVRKNRPVTDQDLKTIRPARIFTASEAKDLHLIDSIGYMDDVLNEAKQQNPDAKIIVYRRERY